jgi:hypothetical integral membrane protein (TIGR02206 family)
VRWSLTAFLLGGVSAYLTAEAVTGDLSVWDFLPLHLCDFAIFVAAYALVTENRLAAEITYFWALSGTVLAMVMPDVAGGFLDWRWMAYFTMHGAVVVSAVVMAAGLGLSPRSGAPWRVLGWTLAYALVVAVVDLVTGANFLYLRRKPLEPTLLDWFGPWPIYIAVVAVVALALFHLLMLPFRKASALQV